MCRVQVFEFRTLTLANFITSARDEGEGREDLAVAIGQCFLSKGRGRMARGKADISHADTTLTHWFPIKRSLPIRLF